MIAFLPARVNMSITISAPRQLRARRAGGVRVLVDGVQAEAVAEFGEHVLVGVRLDVVGVPGRVDVIHAAAQVGVMRLPEFAQALLVGVRARMS